MPIPAHVLSSSGGWLDRLCFTRDQEARGAAPRAAEIPISTDPGARGDGCAGKFW